ncbi:hypothetical protein [uncultured Amaricoccus sp.]|uniref:hypothetical protein n=1 Tax=uncultured Amaricoccus sp. TaxID=339341 RepID=UPI00262547E6|nr:hypothetical protein [uncultured Amaricoccus sp.]
MQIAVNYDDYLSVLAYVRHLSRRLAPIIRDDLPALLGRRTPSGLARVARAAECGRLYARGYARDMLPVLADACTMAIEDGTMVAGEWTEVGYSDAGVDWAWYEATTYTDEARRLMPHRAMVSGLIDLLDRIDDLAAAQRDAGELLNR